MARANATVTPMLGEPRGIFSSEKSSSPVHRRKRMGKASVTAVSASRVHRSGAQGQSVPVSKFYEFAHPGLNDPLNLM